MYQLYYTSAPRGLQPGSAGFCTVAATRGMAAALIEKLEKLSGYRFLHPPVGNRASENPVVYCHQKLAVGAKKYRVLSRVAPAGLDYSQRGNYFAHHIALEASELPACGPVRMLQQVGVMATRWDGQVGPLENGFAPRASEPTPRPCETWRRLVGDAGWAGVLLHQWVENREKPIYVILPSSGEDGLTMLGEALALLPADLRWEVTFSTFFSSLVPGASCAWRCLPPDCPDAVQVKNSSAGAVLHLAPARGNLPPSPYVEQARTGARPPIKVESTFLERPITLRDPGLPASGRTLARERAVTAAPPAAAPGPLAQLPTPESSSLRSWLIFGGGLALGFVPLLIVAILGWLIVDTSYRSRLDEERAKLRTAEEKQRAAEDAVAEEHKATELKIGAELKAESKLQIAKAEYDQIVALLDVQTVVGMGQLQHTLWLRPAISLLAAPSLQRLLSELVMEHADTRAALKAAELQKKLQSLAPSSSAKGK